MNTSPDRCAQLDGYAVHANSAVAAADRRGLEQLLRYCLRGPLATERLILSEDGQRVRYRFGRPWTNGRTHIELHDIASRSKRSMVAALPGRASRLGPAGPAAGVYETFGVAHCTAEIKALALPRPVRSASEASLQARRIAARGATIGHRFTAR